VGRTRIRDLAAEFGIERGPLSRWLAAVGIPVPRGRSDLDDRQVALARAKWEREKRHGRSADGKRNSRQMKPTRRDEVTKSRRNPPRSNWTLTLHRRDTLASLINCAIQEQHEGSTNLAAKSIKREIDSYERRHGEPRFASLSRPQLHRLRHGELRSIGEATLYGLMFLVPDSDALFRTILSPGARELLRRADSFYEHRRLARSTEREEARQRVVQAMRASFPKAFEKFDNLVRNKGHSEQTVELAIDRVAEPFVLAPETGHVDRDWDELVPKEQRDYVRLTLGRERILLSRDHDLERVRLKGLNRFLAAFRKQTAQGPTDGSRALLGHR